LSFFSWLNTKKPVALLSQVASFDEAGLLHYMAVDYSYTIWQKMLLHDTKQADFLPMRMVLTPGKTIREGGSI